MKKLRPLGDITQELEPLLCEMAVNHKLQRGEILSLIVSYIDIHLKDCIEEYEDGSHPEYRYGPRE